MTRDIAKRQRPALALCTLFTLCLTGCAQPDFRSAVYSFNSPLDDIKYTQMHPAYGVPRDGSLAYKKNQFLFLPGAVLIPAVSSTHDDQSRRAAVWRVNYSRDYCNPSGVLYNLNEIERRKLPDIFIDYDLDSKNLFIPQHRDARQSAREELKLNDNDLRWVKQITIQIRNVTEYRANSDQLALAFEEISKRCRGAFGDRPDTLQIERILSAEQLSIDFKLLEGASLKIGNALRGRALKAITKRITGNSLFFAVAARPKGSQTRVR